MLHTVRTKLPTESVGLSMSLLEYWYKLKRFDWYYSFSDDGGVYRAGERRLEELRAIAEVGGEDYQRMIDGFSKHMFSGPSWGTPRAPEPARPEIITVEDDAIAARYDPQYVSQVKPQPQEQHDDYPDGTDVEEMRIADEVAKDHLDAWVGLQTIEMALTGLNFVEVRRSEEQVKAIVALIGEWREEIADLKAMLQREYQAREDVRRRHVKMRQALERMLSGELSFTLSKVRRILLEDL